MEIAELYTRFRPELTAYAVRLTKDRDTAEDLVQEAFLRMLIHWNEVSQCVENACRSWLYTTVRNIFIDRQRRSNRESPDGGEAAALLSFEEDWTHSAVAQLVGRLPESERAIFILRTFKGYNSRELGDLFGLSPATVRSRLASAKKRLREWISE